MYQRTSKLDKIPRYEENCERCSTYGTVSGVNAMTDSVFVVMEEFRLRSDHRAMRLVNLLCNLFRLISRFPRENTSEQRKKGGIDPVRAELLTRNSRRHLARKVAVCLRVSLM